jgi:hypothetical protein
MYAFEVTIDDILNVYQERGTKVSVSLAQAVMDDLNFDLIEEAALRGADIEEQTDFAYEEIKRQLFGTT